MNHVGQWLQAYYDGELDHRTAMRVETHLAACPACCAELEALRALSALLQASPPASLTPTPEQFAAQVALKLPRREREPLAERSLTFLWRLAPLLIVTTWVFVQSVSIVSTGIVALVGLGIGDETLAALLPVAEAGVGPTWPSAALNALGLDAVSAILKELQALRWLAVTPLGIVVFMAVTALAIASWVATWLLRSKASNRMNHLNADG